LEFRFFYSMDCLWCRLALALDAFRAALVLVAIHSRSM
jgi:hypothetical protein